MGASSIISTLDIRLNNVTIVSAVSVAEPPKRVSGRSQTFDASHCLGERPGLMRGCPSPRIDQVTAQSVLAALFGELCESC